MAFRDDTDALRARIDSLEAELVDAHRRLDELGGVELERARLSARVEELEGKLGELDGSQQAKRKREAQAQREAQAREAQKKKDERRKQQEVESAARALGSRGGLVSDETRAKLYVMAGVLGVLGLVIGIAECQSGVISEAILPEPPPSLGLVDFDATPQPAAIQARADGEISAPSGCRGYIPRAPQLVLRASGPEQVRLMPHAVSGDLVMVLRTPDGRVLCDDDGGGSLNPMITTVLPPGDSRLWIGTYGDGAELDLSLEITAQAEDVVPDASGLASNATPTISAIELVGGSLERTLDGTITGAWTAASTTSPACRGFLPLRPALTLELTQQSAVMLEAECDSDLVMLVRTSDGTVLCDDDSGSGSSPRIATVLAPGQHHAWVGTYSQTDGEVPFRLTMSAHEIDFATAPTLGAQELAVGVDTTFRGESAGEVGPSALGASCAGGILPVRPHVVLTLARPQDVVLSFASASAPFVVVQHPGGAFDCITDVSTRSSWQPGPHRVFVGVHDETRPAPFVLTARAEPSSVQPWR